MSTPSAPYFDKGVICILKKQMYKNLVVRFADDTRKALKFNSVESVIYRSTAV